MSPEAWGLVQILVAGIFGFLLWMLRQALVDLRNEIKEQARALDELQKSLWAEFVRKEELQPMRQDIGELFGKYNALAVACAKRHGSGKVDG